MVVARAWQGEGGMETHLMDIESQFCKMKQVLETEGGDGWPTT